MENQFNITGNQYFEDIVIGYSRFKQDFDKVKGRF